MATTVFTVTSTATSTAPLALPNTTTAAVATASPAPTGTPTVSVLTSLVEWQGTVITLAKALTPANRWILSATLSYITTTPTPITYQESFSGTYDQAVVRATAVVKELANLKVAHDGIHVRINDLSAGKA